MDKNIQNQLVAKYPPPMNCTRLQVVSCNEEIFKQATFSCRIKDLSLQKDQLSLLEGITAIIRVLGNMVSSQYDCDITK